MMQGFAQVRQSASGARRQSAADLHHHRSRARYPGGRRRICGSFSPKLIGLTGTQAQVDAAVKAFRGLCRARGQQSAGGYLMDHSRNAYLMGPDGAADRSLAGRQGRRGRGARSGDFGPMKVLREQFWQLPIDRAQPRRMGSPVRWLRQVLPAQGRGCRYRRDLSHQCRLPAARSARGAMQRLPEPQAASARLRAADPAPRRDAAWLPDTCAYRLRAEDEPLPAWHYLISGDREAVHHAGHVGARQGDPRSDGRTAGTARDPAAGGGTGG